MIAEKLADIRARLDAACERVGRDPAEVELLAVTKGHPADVIIEGHAAGQRSFGESYVQDWLGKAEDPRILRLEGLRWRFIGHLQRNKVRFLVGRVELIEAVGSMRLAAEIGKRATSTGRTQAVLLQVNVSDEASKSGFSVSDLEACFGELRAIEGLDVQGLMSIPAPREDAEASRPDHRAVRQLRERLQQAHSHPLPILSMGMSSDFEVAIAEGSTEVRVGTAIFGPRPARA